MVQTYPPDPYVQFGIIAIIIDESQNLDWNVIRLLMDLTEETRVPCCFMGNSAVLRRTRATEPALAQLRSRLVGRTLDLSGNSPADITLIAEANGITDSACQYLLYEISSKSIEHGLRAVNEAMRQARFIAGDGNPIRLNLSAQTFLAQPTFHFSRYPIAV
jgi:hypothetical protein